VFCEVVGYPTRGLVSALMKQHILSGLWLSLAGLSLFQIISPVQEQDQARRSIELRDDAGRVRLQIGALGPEGSFGIRMLDVAGKEQIRIAEDQAGSAIRVSSGNGSMQASISVSSEASQFLLGDVNGKSLRVTRDANGTMSMSYGGSTAAQEQMLLIKCSSDDGDGTSIQLNGRSGSSLQLAAGNGGVRVESTVEGVPGWVAFTQDGIGSKIQLGSRMSGVYLQSAVQDSAVIEVCQQRPVVTIQATPQGLGLAIDDTEGRSLVRFGATAEGELRARIHGKDGDRLKGLPK
jgi:hypothetical protein